MEAESLPRQTVTECALLHPSFFKKMVWKNGSAGGLPSGQLDVPHTGSTRQERWLIRVRPADIVG